MATEASPIAKRQVPAPDFAPPSGVSDPKHRAHAVARFGTRLSRRGRAEGRHEEPRRCRNGETDEREVRHRDRPRGDERSRFWRSAPSWASRPEHLLPYGHDKAKISQDFIKSLQDRPNGKLILVTAINPTPAGEGKTTTTVGLGDGLNRIGKKAVICIREASLGPNFGMKGGAAGGGYAQVVPMEEMNLHFTGDFHAITAAHNLLCGDDRQPHLLGQRAGHRHPPRRLAPGDGHERPGAARSSCSLGGVANGFPARRPGSTSPWPRRSWRSCAWPTTWRIWRSGWAT